MKHLSLLFNFIVFSVGISATGISYFLYRKYKLDVYKKYFIFLLLFSIIYILDFLDFYFTNFILDYADILKLILVNIKTAFSALLLYIIPGLFLGIIRRKINKNFKTFFSLLALLPLVCIIIINLFLPVIADKINYINYLFIILMIIRVLVIIIIAVLGLPLYKKAESLELLYFYKALLLMTAIVIIFNIIGSVGYYLVSSKMSPLMINGHSFVYFIWNLISLIFVYWYFIYRIDEFKAKGKLDILASDNKITKREKEIVLLISQGFSNKDISNKLFISLSTTKTHLRNIFAKINVKSRMELFNLLNS